MRWGQKSRKRSATPSAWQDARDEVTGLLPYAAFVHRCADAVTARGAAGEPAVLLIDLEGVAEAVGADEHTAHDELLRTVAARVAREVGSVGVLARMSDHQLGVLFPTLSAPAVALDLAYRVVSAVSAPVVLASQRRVKLWSSCGLVTWDSMGALATAADLLRGAGLAVREPDRRRGRDARDRQGPPPGAAGPGTAGLLPAAGRPHRRLGDRLRGAGAVEPPGARAGLAEPVRAGR